MTQNKIKEKFNWTSTVRINLGCLRVLGMWPKGKLGYTLTTYTFYALFMNLFVEGHNIFQTAYIGLIYQDLQALVAIFFVLVTDWNAALKIYFFVRNIKLLQHLMAELDTEEFQPKNVEQIRLIKPTLNFWYTMYKMYWVISIIDLFLLSAFPIIDGSYKQHRLPFWAWYPYDVTKSLLYEGTYFYQVYSTWFLALGNLNMDSMSGALMMYIAAQCDLLSNNLKYLSNHDGNFNERLVLYIKQHKKIISFSNTANQFFNELTLGQFFTTCASMALAMFQLTVVGPTTSEGSSLLFYVVAMVVQIFFYCWFGNEAELRVTGLWPKSTDGYELDKYAFYAIFVLVFINSHTIAQTLHIYFVSDLKEFAATIFVLFTEWLTTIKQICFMRNIKILKTLMLQLESDSFQPKTEHQRKTVRSTGNIWKNVYIAYAIPVLNTLTLFSVFPIVDGSFKHYRLPFPAWYPYKVNASPWYQFTYIYQVISFCTIALVDFHMDTIIAALMMFGKAQCEILCDDLRNLSHKKFTENLIKCIQHHRDILRFSVSCNNFFDEVVLGQFFVSAASVAIALFQFTQVDPTSSESFSLVFFVNALIVEVFLYCWFGDELEAQMEYYDHDEKYDKDVVEINTH